MIVLTTACYQNKDASKLTDFVDPFIGVLDHDTSNCVIGPQLPFGSINPSPDTPEGGHDGYSSYQPIRGFSQLHNSGTGWGKYGQILISPQIGLNISEVGHDSPKSNETAKAYYYSVHLNRYNIFAEVTPTHNAAIYAFTFPKSDSAHVIFDIAHNIPRDIATFVEGLFHGGEVKIEINNANTKITGKGRYSGGFGDKDFEYNIYFCAMINKEPNGYGVWKNNKLSLDVDNIETKELNGRLGAFLNFSTEENEKLSPLRKSPLPNI